MRVDESPHFSMSPGSLQRQRPPAALLQTLQHYWSAERRGQGPGTGRWHENQGPLISWVWPISSQHWDSRPIRGLGETCAHLCQAVSVWARDIFAIVAVSESGLQQSVLQYCSALLTAVHSAGVGEGSTTCAAVASGSLPGVICCRSGDNNHVENFRERAGSEFANSPHISPRNWQTSEISGAASSLKR